MDSDETIEHMRREVYDLEIIRDQCAQQIEELQVRIKQLNYAIAMLNAEIGDKWHSDV